MSDRPAAVCYCPKHDSDRGCIHGEIHHHQLSWVCRDSHVLKHRLDACTNLSGFSSTAVLRCDLSGPTSAVCSNYASGGGQISKGKPSTLSPNQIVYQAVEVTSTMNNTSTMPQTVTVTAQHTTTTSTTSSSTAGATATGGPWAMGGALGAGLLALAAM